MWTWLVGGGVGAVGRVCGRHLEVTWPTRGGHLAEVLHGLWKHVVDMWRVCGWRVAGPGSTAEKPSHSPPLWQLGVT